MITKFVGRDKELELLNEEYKKQGFSFIPIYGRRRIGKTELILQFMKNKKGIYFSASEGTELENITLFKDVAKQHFDLTTVKDDWFSILKYIGDNLKEKFIVTIDEYHYLVNADKRVSSKFQQVIDLSLKNKNIFLILSGSSQSIMYKSVLNYKAPLYGRRTGQIELLALKFKDVYNYFKDKEYITNISEENKLEEIIKIYGVTGGVPAYFKYFEDQISFISSLTLNVLPRNSFLREETLFLFRQEFRDPKTYLSIISAIAEGKNSLGEIIDYCGFSNKTSIAPYIRSLEVLGYVKKDISITAKPRSKKTQYRLTDQLIEFWGKVIKPNISMLDNNFNLALENVKKEYSSYLGSVFEKICKELLFELHSDYAEYGRFWQNNTEIDIIALNNKTKNILFCECKYSDNVNSQKIIYELIEKAKTVSWNNSTRKEQYILFAKSFFGSKNVMFENKQIFIYDFKDISKYLNPK